MKQWRTIVLAVTAVLAVLFIVQISNYMFDKKSNSKEHSNTSRPEPVRILSSRRSTTHQTSSATPTTKNFSRKLQYVYRKSNRSRTIGLKKEKNKRSHKHFCWENEDFKIIGKCLRCSTYEKRVSAACQETSNRQLVMCVVSKQKSYKSCPHVRWIEERNFWTFEGTMCVLLLISSMSVWQRNKKLDAIYQEKLRKKVSNDA